MTYLERDLSLDAWRAVKEYLPRDWGTRLRDGTIGPRTGADAEDYQWGLTRFLEEARMLAQFDHPNLVRVYRVFEARGTRPVIDVSWNDAQAYVSWLSAETGETYRLPSEAEWEYAARAGTDTAFNWGNELGDNRANCGGCGSRWDGEQTAPTGSI